MVDFIADDDTDSVERNISTGVDVFLAHEEIMDNVGQATYVIVIHQLEVQSREAMRCLVPGLEVDGKEKRSIVTPRKQVLIPIGVGDSR